MKIIIEYDGYAESPRAVYDYSSALFAWHRRYHFDIYDHERQAEVFDALEKSNLVKYDEYEDITPSELYNLVLSATDTIASCLPVYMHEHGGVVLNTDGFSCPWDSGQLGFICMTMDRAKELLQEVDRATVEEILRAEVEELSLYAQGEVYFVSIEDDEGEVVEQCCGLLGEEGVLAYLKDISKLIDKGAEVIAPYNSLKDKVVAELGLVITKSGG